MRITDSLSYKIKRTKYKKASWSELQKYITKCDCYPTCSKDSVCDECGGCEKHCYCATLTSSEMNAY